jgi:hypothetical protein
MSYIKRAVTVIEYVEDDGSTHAMLVVQDHGTCDFSFEEDYDWSFDGGFMHREYHTRPRRTNLRIDGYGEVTFFANADDLFARWNGPQPGQPRAAIEPHRDAIEPHRGELEP